MAIINNRAAPWRGVATGIGLLVLFLVPLLGCEANATVHVKGRKVAEMRSSLLTPPEGAATEKLIEAQGTVTVVRRQAPAAGEGG